MQRIVQGFVLLAAIFASHSIHDFHLGHYLTEFAVHKAQAYYQHRATPGIPDPKQSRG